MEGSAIRAGTIFVKKSISSAALAQVAVADLPPILYFSTYNNMGTCNRL